MGTKRIGVVGARGYVGREVLGLLAKDADVEISLVTSRAHEGQRAQEVFDGVPLDDDLKISRSDPEIVAAAGCDAVILGMPNGMAAPYAEALSAGATHIVDLSADYRHRDGWVFGMTDLSPTESVGAKLIANPGCYATAAILALYPIREVLAGTPSVFGVSGYSGAGTSPSPKNDPERLSENLLPYGFAGHGHQAEISQAIGRAVRFVPHVASFFRGLMVTVTAPVVAGTTEGDIIEAYRGIYAGNPTIALTDVPPELKDYVGTPKAAIGGVAIDPETNCVAVTCVHDNLLKGAASQAYTNLRLGLGLAHPYGRPME